MKLNLIRGYRGGLTKNQYLPEGEYDLDDPLAALLIRKGFAVLVESPPELDVVEAVIDVYEVTESDDPLLQKASIQVHLVSITKPAKKLMKEWNLSEDDFPNETLISKPMVDAYVLAHFITDDDEQG